MPIKAEFWTDREDDVLRRAFADGHSDRAIAQMLSLGRVQRNSGGVRKRRQKLGLLRTEHAIEVRREKEVERSRRIMGALSADADPLTPTPQTKEVEANNIYLAMCMREARASGYYIATVRDLRDYYVAQCELDIIPSHPTDIPISTSDRCSMIGSQF